MIRIVMIGSSPISSRTSVAVIITAIVIFGSVGIYNVIQNNEIQNNEIQDRRRLPPSSPAKTSLRVPLWVPTESVVQRSRLSFTFDPPDALTQLRQQEGLDGVIAGAQSEEDKLRLLMRWTRDQFEPGRPDPYPSPDARIILNDIRSGRTGGFCAQYCFIFVQAAGSFGIPVRMITIEGHEICEGWLASERRWTVFDPLYSLQIFDLHGRSLSALEVQRAVESGTTLRLPPGHNYPGTDSEYLNRYRLFAVWLRNDFVTSPMNFTDFTRYRVFFDPAQDDFIPVESLSTNSELDLYPQ